MKPCILALVDLEPALKFSMTQLLQGYDEFVIAQDEAPDVVLASPARPERLAELRRRYPEAYILARVPWDRRGYWNSSDLDERIDELASFSVVLSTLQRVRSSLLAQPD